MPANLPIRRNPTEPPTVKLEKFHQKLVYNGMTRPTFWEKIKIALKLRNLIQDPTMKEKLLSRKLWITVISAALTAAAGYFGLDPELAAKIIAGIVGTYLVGQSAVDVTKEIKANPPAKTSKEH